MADPFTGGDIHQDTLQPAGAVTTAQALEQPDFAVSAPVSYDLEAVSSTLSGEESESESAPMIPCAINQHLRMDEKIKRVSDLTRSQMEVYSCVQSLNLSGEQAEKLFSMVRNVSD
jgi:hypothetical protein